MSYLSRLSDLELSERIKEQVAFENSIPQYVEMLLVEAAKRLEKQAQMEDDGK